MFQTALEKLRSFPPSTRSEFMVSSVKSWYINDIIESESAD